METLTSLKCLIITKAYAFRPKLKAYQFKPQPTSPFHFEIRVSVCDTYLTNNGRIQRAQLF